MAPLCQSTYASYALPIILLALVGVSSGASFVQCRDRCLCTVDLTLVDCKFDANAIAIDLRPQGAFSQPLTAVQSGIFDAFTSLINITLANNALIDLDPDVFQFNTALRRVDLRNNSIVFLPDSAFSNVAIPGNLTVLVGGNPASRGNLCSTASSQKCVTGTCASCVCTSSWRGSSCQTACNATSTCCPGYYLRADSPLTCLPCPRGSYCTGDGLARNCSPGSSQPRLRHDRCVPCAYGTYAPTAGLSECSQCPSQYVCPTGAWQPLSLTAQSSSASDASSWPLPPGFLSRTFAASGSPIGFYGVVGALYDSGAADASFDWRGVTHASWAFAVLFVVLCLLAIIRKVRSAFFRSVDVAYDYSHRVDDGTPLSREKKWCGGLALLLALACIAMLFYLYADLYANGDGRTSIGLVDDVMLQGAGYPSVPFGLNVAVVATLSAPFVCVPTVGAAGLNGHPSVSAQAQLSNASCAFDVICEGCSVIAQQAMTQPVTTTSPSASIATDAACLTVSLGGNTSISALMMSFSLMSSAGNEVQRLFSVVAAAGDVGTHPPLDADANSTSAVAAAGLAGGVSLATRRFVVDHYMSTRKRTGLRVSGVSWGATPTLPGCATIAGVNATTGVFFISIDAGSLTSYERVQRADTPQTLAAQCIATAVGLLIIVAYLMRLAETASRSIAHQKSPSAKYLSAAPPEDETVKRGSFYVSRRLNASLGSVNAFSEPLHDAPSSAFADGRSALNRSYTASMAAALNGPDGSNAKLTRQQTRDRLAAMNSGTAPRVETLEDAMDLLGKDRRAHNRPSELRAMNDTQMYEERLAIKTILFEYETGFKDRRGRELTKSEKEHMRPLYRRYRSLKVTGPDTAAIDEEAQSASARWRIAAVKGRGPAVNTFNPTTLKAAQDIYAEELREMKVLDSVITIETQL